MSNAIGNVGNLTQGISKLLRLAPEPRGGSTFGTIFNGITSAVSSTAGALGDVNPVFLDLINKQIQTQYEMQVVSFESNVEKSKHETQMAPIRNIRVG